MRDCFKQPPPHFNVCFSDMLNRLLYLTCIGRPRVPPLLSQSVASFPGPRISPFMFSKSTWCLRRLRRRKPSWPKHCWFLMWVFTPLWKAFIFHGRVHAKGTCLFERQAGERNFRYSCCILLQMCRRKSRWTTLSRKSSWSNTKGKTAVIIRLQKPSRWPSANEQCTDGQLFGFGASRKILTSTTPKEFLRSSKRQSARFGRPRCVKTSISLKKFGFRPLWFRQLQSQGLESLCFQVVEKWFSSGVTQVIFGVWKQGTWLVGGFKHFFLFSIIYINIWDVILPIDFHIFQDGEIAPPTSDVYWVGKWVISAWNCQMTCRGDPIQLWSSYAVWFIPPWMPCTTSRGMHKNDSCWRLKNGWLF